MAYETGRRIVEMVREDLTPSKIMTRAAFENAIVVNSAIGGSTNCPPHLIAIARHLGVELDIKDWQNIGLRRAAAGECDAGGQMARRGVPSRGRCAGGDRGIDSRGAPASGRADGEWKNARRQLRESDAPRMPT